MLVTGTALPTLPSAQRGQLRSLIIRLFSFVYLFSFVLFAYNLSGRITNLHLPGGLGVRVDTHIFAGYEVPPFYDSLLAKLVIWAETRDEALNRARRALAEMSIEGPATNLSFHRATVNDSQFATGSYHAGYVEALQDRVASATV